MTVAAIIAIIQADKVLKRLREKILSNRGTFRDTFEYSNRAAELLGANFSESVLAMSLDDRVSACVELLRDRYDDIMPLLDAVQKRADLKNKLTIAPKHPPFNAERAEQIGTSLRDLSVSDERIQRRARSAPATATRAIHDDYIEANVELRSSAGIKCYITRVTDGNCCDWCTRVAGRYEYGTEPEGIFHRHDNCGCSVTYENGRERQDVWSKKTWTVPEDAGAPEPVRFTQEQAAAAGAEPPRVFSVGEARELNDVKVKENTAKLEKVEGAYTEDKVPKQQEFESYALKGSADIQFDRLDGSKSISSELAEEYRAEYDKFTEMFGELPSLNGIDIAPYANDDTYGQYYPESRRIVIYGAGGKSGDKFLLQSAQEHKRIEEWSTDSKYHSFRHELGHALQMEHSLNDKYWEKKKTEIEALRSSIVLALTNSDGSVKIKELKGKLSKYGFVDTDEFISECVAEYFQNPKKARSTSKKVIEIIMRGDEYYADVNS